MANMWRTLLGRGGEEVEVEEGLLVVVDHSTRVRSSSRSAVEKVTSLFPGLESRLWGSVCLTVVGIPLPGLLDWEVVCGAASVS